MLRPPLGMADLGGGGLRAATSAVGGAQHSRVVEKRQLRASRNSVVCARRHRSRRGRILSSQSASRGSRAANIRNRPNSQGRCDAVLSARRHHKARCIHSCYKNGRERQIRLPLFPIVGTVRCRRSLRGPRRRPNGTGLSSAITIAPLVAVPSTRAPEHLAPEHCAVCAKSAIHSCAHCSCTGHTQEKRSLRCTRGCVWSALKCQLRMAIATA